MKKTVITIIEKKIAHLGEFRSGLVGKSADR